MRKVAGMPGNFRAGACWSNVAEDGHFDFQFLESLCDLLVVCIPPIDADGAKRHLGIVLVSLVDFFQFGKALLARAAPGGPKVEQDHFSQQRFEWTGLPSRS